MTSNDLEDKIEKKDIENLLKREKIINPQIKKGFSMNFSIKNRFLIGTLTAVIASGIIFYKDSINELVTEYPNKRIEELHQKIEGIIEDGVVDTEEYVILKSMNESLNHSDKTYFNHEEFSKRDKENKTENLIANLDYFLYNHDKLKTLHKISWKLNENQAYNQIIRKHEKIKMSDSIFAQVLLNELENYSYEILEKQPERFETKIITKGYVDKEWVKPEYGIVPILPEERFDDVTHSMEKIKDGYWKEIFVKPVYGNVKIQDEHYDKYLFTPFTYEKKLIDDFIKIE